MLKRDIWLANTMRNPRGFLKNLNGDCDPPPPQILHITLPTRPSQKWEKNFMYTQTVAQGL